jgi:hypothetical protein
MAETGVAAQIAKPTPDVARNGHPPEVVPAAAGRVSDERSVMALQRTAGNQAVATLMPRGARPDVTRRAVATRLAVQRFWGDEELNPTPEEPIESDFEPPMIQWPSEAEGERNEPCFTPESQAAILEGVAQADVGASGLFKMPPDLEASALALVAAREVWEQTGGSEPGSSQLSAATALVGGASERVAIYVAKAREVFEAAAEGTRSAAKEARAAATAMEEPEEPQAGQAPAAPEPCFDPNQVGLINEASNLADAAAAEIDQRPPNFRKSIEYVRAAAEQLQAIGGTEPGQQQLKGAIATLDRVANLMEAYVTPVEKVVKEAAEDAQKASAMAREASDMSIRGPHAPPQEEFP